MIDMKLTPEQSPGATMLAADENNGPQYPYGLTITLDNAALKKLAMGQLPQVGEQMTLKALVEVVGVNKSGGQIENDRTVTLQITAMQFGDDEASMDPASKLYG
jgi:hypothetical protein